MYLSVYLSALVNTLNAVVQKEKKIFQKQSVLNKYTHLLM